MALQPVAHTTLMCPESSTLRYDDSPSDQLSRLKLVFMQHTAQCMPLKEAAQVGVDIVTRCHCYSGQRLDSASSTIKSNRKTTHLLLSAARCSTCSWRSCALLRSWSTLDTASCLARCRANMRPSYFCCSTCTFACTFCPARVWWVVK